ncbi:alanine/glycine:cation symporter family protein [Microbulbifer bruguierae]|uniref:Alanine/glycine:cation symporter family protein n=1 Tax=Microbulbifer bruguierae TaxID=3029061 RepID=A0ABY8NA57_9GAMM|nr:alanine/glycine:cation symporter family protein [Microbulbifer bruguierae]WGL15794.1 alanine/glycine:cation symporter family protein [Microbulbifer bruguierae]
MQYRTPAGRPASIFQGTRRSLLLAVLSVLPTVANAAEAGAIDAWINSAMAPVTQALSAVVFYSVPVFGADLPLVVLWLVIAAIFFTVYFGFINLRGLSHALRIVSGKHKITVQDSDGTSGEVSHFQALATAVSGTVGIGNIGGVAVAISVGGPGAAFWMIVAGVLGMATKFVECTLGTLYRRENPDGSVSGGPMYYLERGFAQKGFTRSGKFLGRLYAVGIVIGCLGIGNMFQANQAYMQFVNVTGGTGESWFADKGWVFGLGLAVLVALVIVGGIRSIARVTGKVVPFMALFYCIGALVILMMNREALPFAFGAIFEGAFSAEGVAGGVLGVMVVGFQRAVFSNEAGIGSAAIAHSAVKTNDPVTEGYVALLEPFIDTVIISTMTALVIITTLYYVPGFTQGLGGIEMTSLAFERNVSWSPYFIALAGFLFAFSTLIAWAYYGLKGWTYLVGEGKKGEAAFKLFFCLFVVIGCSIQLSAILDFSDAMVFFICVPNIIGLYMLAPVAKRYLTEHNEKFRTQVGENTLPDTVGNS